MSSDRVRVEPRAHLAELEPDLRERLLALDEPVSRDDWRDVTRRSRAGRPWSRRVGPVAAVGAVLAAAVTGIAVAVQAGGVGGAPRALQSQLAAGGHVLYLVPTAHGGYCYRWTGVTSGCTQLDTAQLAAAPLDVSWGTSRVVGTISPDRISAVRIRFTDGTSARPRIAWAATPVRAGFFVYAIPAGKTVAEINGYDAGRLVRRVTWFSV
jgi:hypothetical protein